MRDAGGARSTRNLDMSVITKDDLDRDFLGKLGLRPFRPKVPAELGRVLPGGGAWAFFTAQIRTQEGDTDRRLFASRFDPELESGCRHAAWAPAPPSSAQRPWPTARESSISSTRIARATSSETWSQLVYQRFVDGSWTDPVPVAPHPDAGHQMLASLAIDERDGLHVVWRDQRFVDA